MNKISPKNIQMFVAGALALSGFRDVFWLPYYFISAKDTMLIVSSLLAGLALFVGIAILIENTKAIYWAIVYLTLSVGFSLVIMIYSMLQTTTHHTPSYGWKVAASIVTPLTLLVLLLWSRSRCLQNESAA